LNTGKLMLITLLIVSITTVATGESSVKYNELTEKEKNIIQKKGTEQPFTGKYWNLKDEGTYICRQCNIPLYKSSDKFESNCGWPSFDDALPGAVKRQPDADGRRVEIVCATCGGHLGHVFEGERFTPKNTRHCVNSLSMKFISSRETMPEPKLGRAIFAGGCFWGVEYFMQKAPGVISVVSGYTGGSKMNPTYREVCSKTTGHVEAVEIKFNPNETDFETLARLFFEIHDPTQLDRQGPDVGEQYRSEIFYLNDEQKKITEKLIKELVGKGFAIATKITPASTFWPAEPHHQDYYENKGTTPYCHGFVKRF